MHTYPTLIYIVAFTCATVYLPTMLTLKPFILGGMEPLLINSWDQPAVIVHNPL